MKFFIGCVVVVIGLAGQVYSDDGWHRCDTDYDCDYDECCIEDRFSTNGLKICRDRGDDPGDLCGGRFYCGCERGYNCVPHPLKHRDSPWLRASNGTCQFDHEAFRIRAGSYARRPPLRRTYVPDFDDLDDVFDDDDFDDSFDDDRRRRRRR